MDFFTERTGHFTSSIFGPQMGKTLLSENCLALLSKQENSIHNVGCYINQMFQLPWPLEAYPIAERELMYSQYVRELQQLYSLNQECKNVLETCQRRSAISITTVHHNYFNFKIFKMPNVMQVTCRNCLIHCA